MTKGEFRTLLKRWLNRSDCTDTDADFFINRALARINREGRFPSMERVAAGVAESDGSFQQIAIPPDFLAARDLVADQRKLHLVTLGQLLRQPPNVGTPQYVARVGGAFQLRPFASEFATLYYWGQFDPLVEDTDTNAILSAHPEVLLWCALSYGGDFFRMDDTANWEARYSQERDTLNLLAQDADIMGGPTAVAPYGDGADY